MADVSFSMAAEQDLLAYFQRSLAHFGKRQTERYFNELDRELGRLANGYRLTVVPIEEARNLLRYRYVKHYIFFVPVDTGIFVSRVVHTSRLQSSLPYPVPAQK